jgi:hypothetical protein
MLPDRFISQPVTGPGRELSPTALSALAAVAARAEMRLTNSAMCLVHDSSTT